MRNWILRDGQKSVLGGTRKHTDECVKIVEETNFGFVYIKKLIWYYFGVYGVN